MLIVTKNVLAVNMLVDPQDAGDGPPKLGTGSSKTRVQKTLGRLSRNDTKQNVQDNILALRLCHLRRNSFPSAMAQKGPSAV